VPSALSWRESAGPAALVRKAHGARLGGIEEILANSALGPRDPSKPHFLSPIGLQAIKGCLSETLSALDPVGARGSVMRDDRLPETADVRLGIVAQVQGTT
jgi:hypothetical protein